VLFDSGTITLLKNKILSDGFIDLPAVGNSMQPLIQKEDTCRFCSVDPSKLLKGDIVLFYTEWGQLVAHRFMYSSQSNGQPYFHLKGDSNLGFDQPIKEQQLMGKLSMIQRGSKTIRINGFSASLWGWLILSFPFFSRVIRTYINRKELGRY
jgi:signal peptidase I